MSLKHEATIKRLLANMHESWFDQDDKDWFDEQMLAMYGKELDNAIEVGLLNGYSLEEQTRLTLMVLDKIK